MKFQLICFTLITFCITNSLSAACDDPSMTANATCIANTTCEWKAKSTGTCGETTTNEAGNNCVDQSTPSTCNGKCKYTETNVEEHTGTCAAGTKLQDEATACSSASTSSACNGGCTWTPDYECAVRTASPGGDNNPTSPTSNDTTNSTNTTGTDTTNPTNNAFRLKISTLISLGLITLF